jgi:ATP-dependent helicase/nuclease subunit B
MKLIIKEMELKRYEDHKERILTNHVFIVPNRFTMSTERDIFETLNLEGADDITICSFARLATVYLRKKAAKRCLTREGSVLVLKKVIDKLKSKLKRYGRAADTTNFAKEMFAVINAIRNSGYEPEKLLSVTEQVSNTIALKLHDIALLYSGYLESLEGMDDAVTKLERYRNLISTSEDLKLTRFYVAGFVHFTSKEKKIISELIKYSKSLAVALTIKTDGDNKELYPNDLASEIEGMGQMLNFVADIKIKNIEIKEPFCTINKELFAYKGGVVTRNLSNKDSGSVIVYKENTVFDEANRIACEIAYLVRHHEYRYKDIAVINCDPTFIEILTSILNRYKIPYFADLKYPLQETILYNYLVSALEVKAFNLRVDKVLKLVKSPIFGIDHDLCCQFENHVIKYNINFNAFEKPFLGDDSIKPIEQVRSKLISVIGKNLESTKATAKEFVQICKGFMLKDDFTELYEKAISEIEGDIKLTLVNLRAHAKLSEILTEIEELLTDFSASFTSHIDTFKAMVAAVQLSLIPQSLDSVFVGNILESRFNGLKAVFVTGAAASLLPSEKGYFSMITATDTDILAENDITIYPNPVQLMKEEEFLLLDIIARVKERFYIGYATTLPNGTLLRPSNAFKEICRITGVKPTSLEDRFMPEQAKTRAELEDCAVSMENTYFQFLASLGRENRLDALAQHNKNVLLASLNEEFKQKVKLIMTVDNEQYVPDPEFFFGKAITKEIQTVSVSQLESYFRCPHLHYLRYGVKLRERETARIEITDVGNIVHRALENYFKATMGRLRDGSLEGLDFLKKVAHESTDEAIERLLKKDSNADVTKKNIISRIKKECLKAIDGMTSNILRSKYTPLYIEAGFGENQDFPYIVITAKDSNVFYMRGKIDRIDTYNDKAVVIDYKTGSVIADLKDVYSGLKIQLFTYLNAIEAKGYLPVAAFYIPVRDSYQTDKDADYNVMGHVVNYDNMYNDFDESAYSAGDSGRLSSPNWPVTLKFSKTTKSLEPTSKKYVLSEDVFKHWINYTKDVASIALNEIVNGYNAKSPLKDNMMGGPCDKCTFMRVCGSEGEDGARQTPKVPAQMFENSQEQLN